MTTICVNTQSSIRLSGSKVLYFDPYQIEKECGDADFIFITHDHYDHFDIESIRKVLKQDTILVLPKGMISKVQTLGISFDHILGVEVNQDYEFSSLSFSTVPSYNLGKSFHPKEKGWVGYVIYFDESIYYVAGDTDYILPLSQIQADVFFVPIGGTYTMNLEEAATFVNERKPKLVVPIHYGSIVGTLNDGIDFSSLLHKDIECYLILNEKEDYEWK